MSWSKVIANAYHQEYLRVLRILSRRNKMSELSEAQIELPRYKCIKEVQAVKIRFVKTLNHGAELYFDDPRYKPLFVDELYRCKHNPSAGGYYVRYKDGYQSWSPADAFEEGYQLIEEPK